MALLTLNFESEYLNQAQYLTVILPDKPDGQKAEEFYASHEKYKVLWLLHGPTALVMSGSAGRMWNYMQAAGI